MWPNGSRGLSSDYWSKVSGERQRGNVMYSVRDLGSVYNMPR